MDKQNVVWPHNGILLSHKKRNEVMIQATWMNLKNITLSERSQIQMATNCMWFPLYEISRIGKSIETESRFVFARDRESEKQWVLNGYRVFLGGDKVFWNLIEVVIVRYCECTEWYWAVPFKMVLYYVNFTSIFFKRSQHCNSTACQLKI